ncbi:MAG: hypothetical protein K1X73_07585 [Bacteroidia bacterium]|nr:hypothetical protein [Bacteroidia bacterium]HCI58577.1 hypothetical protein [Bacteroidota bacterium]MCC7515342.1 hypothetical protein [Bacteroidia bacterium]HMU76244.1 hypothetical protein [Bacteroidia bacterium]HMW10918.1 hypothetical protein [Bacteroidia bacterium]
MKKYIINIKFLALSSLVLIFQSCKKDTDSPGDGPTYTITGRLFEDCNMQPVANQKIDLFQEYSTGLDGNLNGGILAQTTTDANGNFKFDFKDMDGFTESIRIPAGQGYTKLFQNIPQNQSLFDLRVYKSPTTNIKVNLIVNNSYTNLDTLRLTDFNNLSTPYKISGPFTSSLLYESVDFPILNFGYPQNILNFGYKLNNNSEVMSTPTITTCGITNIEVVIN